MAKKLTRMISKPERMNGIFRPRLAPNIWALIEPVSGTRIEVSNSSGFSEMAKVVVNSAPSLYLAIRLYSPDFSFSTYLPSRTIIVLPSSRI